MLILNSSENMIDADDAIVSSTPVSLPEGKLYHVFVSYREIEEDRTWVRNLISNLQSIYHFACFEHATDFEPGRKITENITYAITKSMKTIVVLTKEYIESYWCEYEAEYALHMNMEMKERILIPLLKEECEIPDFLKPFTYIDARGDINTWIEKLVSAIQSTGSQYNNEILTKHHSLNTVTSNLEILHQETTHLNCCGPVFNTQYVPQRLHDEPTHLDPELFQEIMTRISSTSLVKRRHCCNFWYPTILFWTSICTNCSGLAMWLLLSTTDEFYSDYHGFGVVAPLLFLVFLAVIVMPAVGFYNCWKGAKEINTIMMESNRKLIPHKLMMFITRKILKADITVAFLYYDIDPCREYINNALNSRSIEGETLEINNSHSSAGHSDLSVNIQDEDSELLIENERRHSNSSLYIEENMNNASNSRSTEVGNMEVSNLHSSLGHSDVSVNIHNEDSTTLLVENERHSHSNLPVEDQAVKRLLEISVQYLNDFTTSKLKTTGIKRHISKAICLCQYMELKE